MSDVFKALVGVISTAAFLCLCLFVAQMTILKKVDWLSRVFDDLARNESWRRSSFYFFKVKAYLILGCFGFLTCIGAGTYLLLWWVPTSWGWLDSDGSWTGLRLVISVLSAFFIGGAIVKLLTDFIELKVTERLLRENLRNSEIEAEGYKSLLRYGEHIGALERIKSQFEWKLNELTSGKSAYDISWNERRLKDIYSTLVEMAKDRIKALREKDPASAKRIPQRNDEGNASTRQPT